MNTPVYDFIDKAQYCNNIEELCSLVEKVLHNMGFSQWAYETKVDTPMGKQQHFFHKFPEKWVEYYMAENCFDVDPVVLEGKKLNTPFQWTHIYPKDLPKERKDYLALSREHGMHDGVAVPIPQAGGRKSIFSITGYENKTDITHAVEDKHQHLISIACAFHAIAADFIRDDAVRTPQNPLTERERECVVWTAKGKTSWEISQILNIAERTVIFHLNNSRRKVGASNKYQLVVECVKNAYVQV